MLIEISDREAEVIRVALRLQYETHKRNDFKTLMVETDDLRSKMNDLILDNHRVIV